MKLIKVAVFSVLAAATASSFAAKPRSIVLDAEHEAADGSGYATYMVICTDGSERELTAWQGSKKWCIGNTDSEHCERKQIKAAKKACSLG